MPQHLFTGSFDRDNKRDLFVKKMTEGNDLPGSTSDCGIGEDAFRFCQHQGEQRCGDRRALHLVEIAGSADQRPAFVDDGQDILTCELQPGTEIDQGLLFDGKGDHPVKVPAFIVNRPRQGQSIALSDPAEGRLVDIEPIPAAVGKEAKPRSIAQIHSRFCTRRVGIFQIAVAISIDHQDLGVGQVSAAQQPDMLGKILRVVQVKFPQGEQGIVVILQSAADDGLVNPRLIRYIAVEGGQPHPFLAVCLQAHGKQQSSHQHEANQQPGCLAQVYFFTLSATPDNHHASPPDRASFVLFEVYSNFP
ncbi:MAG: hypothetical protein ACD_75C01299G0002 [uncultured bacterium]|nr:MAG: hypothetical protein ACD_75C01299G0002 [uncultured bacterium]